MFEFFGLDILDWFRDERPWPQFLRLISRLPQHSRYKALLVQDDEWAEAVAPYLSDADSENDWTTAEGWTRETDALNNIVDVLQAIKSVLISAHGGRGGRVTPMPRPRTALEKAKKIAAQQRHLDRVRLMTGRDPTS